MNSIQRTHFAPIAVLVAIALLWPHSAQALDDELSGTHLEPLVPKDLDGYTLENVDVKEDSPTVTAEYRSEAEDASFRFAIEYGKEAAERYREIRGKLSIASAEGEADTGELSIRGRTFVTVDMSHQFIAMAYFNHFLVGVNANELEDPESVLADFLEKVDLNRIAEWSPPDEVEYTLAEMDSKAPDCYDMDCFSEHVSRCENAQLIGALGRRITAKYAVEEQLAADQCQISLVFTDNPNPEWENTPLYFTVNPAEGFAMDDVKAVFKECVEGDGDSYGCEGPLLDRMKNE